MAFTTGKLITNALSLITNAQLAAMPSNTVKANATAGSAAPQDFSVGLSQLLGRGSSGNLAPITLGANLVMSGTTISAIGGGSSGSGTFSIDDGSASATSSFIFEEGGA